MWQMTVKNARHIASGEEGDSMTALAAADLASAVIKLC